MFIAADESFPQRLSQEGLTRDGGVVYAIGQLALIVSRVSGTHLEKSASYESVLAKANKVAIANPDLAPYGKAAVQYLKAAKLWDGVKGKLVFGENISETAQYVSSGNADAGFVALSLVLSPRLKDKGRWVEVPPSLYSPILQSAVLTTQGGPNRAARRYLEFLTGSEARAIFALYGYGTP